MNAPICRPWNEARSSSPSRGSVLTSVTTMVSPRLSASRNSSPSEIPPLSPASEATPSRVYSWRIV